MNKDHVVQMLQHIRNDKYIGPKTDNLPIGERVIYALENGLVDRSTNGNLILTDKGLDLLQETTSRENM